MNDKRRKLRARFREVALQQLDQIRPALGELVAGGENPESVRTIGRVLHTLKGDASLVGVQVVSDTLHAAEDQAAARAWSQLAEMLAALVRDLQRMGEDGRIPEPASTSAPAPPATTPAAATTTTTTTTPPTPAAATTPTAPTPPTPAAAATPTTVPPPSAAAPTPTPPPTPIPSADAAAPAPSESVSRQRWIHLQTDVLDDLSDRLLELSTLYGRLAARLGQAVRETPTETLRIAVDDADAARRQLDDAVGAAWSLRLVPVEDTLRRLGVHAAEIAQSQGKRMRVHVDGGHAELERSTLDAIEQPLIHLVRNAVDHGIEEPGARGDKPAEATLSLVARTVGGAVEIVVEDDGRGVDPETVRSVAVQRGLLRADEAATLSEQATFDLLFLYGFSTRSQASALSGRGVGLDAVRGKVEGLGGAVQLSSRPGQGARFVIAVPAAIARERAVVVECTAGVFAFPSRAIVALVRLGDHPRREVAGGVAIEHGGGWAPMRALDDVLGPSGGGRARDDDKAPGLVVEAHGLRYVFAVDRIVGEHDLLRRPADPLVGHGGMVTASSVLDDGRVALWPAIPALLRGLRARTRGSATPSQGRRRRRVLVVEDSPVVRELVTSILHTAELDTVAAGDGEDALQVLAGGPPDLIISDVEMPRVDGFELLRRVRERWPRLPVVMLTTRGSEDDRRRAATLGADAYLIKAEFEQSRLIDTVHRLIGDLA